MSLPTVVILMPQGAADKLGFMKEMGYAAVAVHVGRSSLGLLHGSHVAREHGQPRAVAADVDPSCQVADGARLRAGLPHPLAHARLHALLRQPGLDPALGLFERAHRRPHRLGRRHHRVRAPLDRPGPGRPRSGRARRRRDRKESPRAILDLPRISTHCAPSLLQLLYPLYYEAGVATYQLHSRVEARGGALVRARWPGARALAAARLAGASQTRRRMGGSDRPFPI